MAQDSKLKRATLEDVARHACVSTATVSRALNKTGVVSGARMRLIEEACEALDYVANGAARALSSNRSMTIGAIVPSLQNETFYRALTVFQQTVHEAGYTLLVANSEFDPDIELREVTTLLQHGIDAIMIVGSIHHEKMWARIRDKGIPCVQAWTIDGSRPCVGFDHHQAAKAMANHLLDLGHRRIAVLVGTPVTNDRASARVEGTRAALRQYGVDILGEMTRSFSLEDGRKATEELLSRPNPPTAIICGNDALAFGVQIAAKAKGVRIPQDLSVAGFNDFEYAAHLDPPLTTVRVNLEEIGRASGKMLLDMIGGKPGSQTILSYDLVLRKSTGPVPAGSKV